MQKYSDKNKIPISQKRVYLKAFVFATILIFFAQFSSAEVYADYKPKIAILIPEKSSQALTVRSNLAEKMELNSEILDFSLAESVWDSRRFDTPYNLTLEQSQNVGTAIGCDFFLLLKTDTLQRISVETDNYIESYLALFLVSSRTGRLVFWDLESFRGADIKEAKTKLTDSFDEIARRIFKNLKTARKKELNEEASSIEEPPLENTPEAKDFRPPLPYRRLRPKYTDKAYLYSVKATIDVLVDIDHKGEILRTEVVRWGGFGLDKSAIKTIKNMNWRPAEKNGKFLPMRILLRYNFKKIEK